MRDSLRFPTGLARAFGGAIIFSLPLLMTMEMWWLGFYMDRLRLCLLLILLIPLLAGLSFHAGFEETFNWSEDFRDALIAFAVAFAASAAVLLLFNLIKIGMPPGEVLGQITLQAVPASFGAVLARAQFGAKTDRDEQREKETGYWGELFHMTAGAMFFAFNVAPTEEMIVIGFKMTPWHALALAIASLLVMHAFVHVVEFRGHAGVPEGMTHASVFMRFTVVGYALALLVSAASLWFFGRMDDTSLPQALMSIIVLAFPASIGAAAARLIL